MYQFFSNVYQFSHCLLARPGLWLLRVLLLVDCIMHGADVSEPMINVHPAVTIPLSYIFLLNLQKSSSAVK